MAAAVVVAGLILVRSLLIAASPAGLTLELIHRDSVKSPFRDAKSNSFSRLRACADRSLVRAAYLSSRISLTSAAYGQHSVGSSIQSEIVPNSFEYLMRLSIGKSKSILAIVDTGSDLIWVQCKPCKFCYNQTAPLFDPSASSTYKPVACAAPACAALPRQVSSCDSQQCSYQYLYGDSSYAIGNLATETFTFGGRRTVQIPRIIFGCTHESEGNFGPSSAGIVGLGGGRLSLASQLGDAIGHKFSYCLTPLKNGSSSTINFGSRPVGHGAVSTPIIRGDIPTFFFLNLERISVAGSSEIIAVISGKSIAGGNIVIDSGTTMMVLEDETLLSLYEVLVRVVKLPPTREGSGPMNLCFASENDEFVPDITFHFQGGADMVLKPINSFIRTDERKLCLAMIPSYGSFNVLGNMAQQNFDIEFDLSHSSLTITPAHCTNPFS